jgi:hypothetical protein
MEAPYTVSSEAHLAELSRRHSRVPRVEYSWIIYTSRESIFSQFYSVYPGKKDTMLGPVVSSPFSLNGV